MFDLNDHFTALLQKKFREISFDTRIGSGVRKCSNHEKVRIQTSDYSSTLRDCFPRMKADEGLGTFYKARLKKLPISSHLHN